MVITGSHLIAALAGWVLYNKYFIVIPPVDITCSEIGWSRSSISGGHLEKIGLKKAEIQFQNWQLNSGSFETK